MELKKYAWVLAVIVITLVIATEPSLARDPSELIGKPVPDFTLSNYAMKPVTLSEYREQVVMLVFWYPDDVNSTNALPKLEPIYQKYKDEGLKIFAIDVSERTSKALMFLARNNLTFDFLIGIYRDALEIYLIDGTPTFILVDRQGIVQSCYSGYDDGDEIKLERSVEVLINRKTGQ